MVSASVPNFSTIVVSASVPNFSAIVVVSQRDMDLVELKRDGHSYEMDRNNVLTNWCLA